MDSENSIVKAIEAYEPFMNEEFLISITNKGIYNRSVKDLSKDQGAVALSESQGTVTATLSGDIQVTMDTNIAKCKCTCPSQTTCKHIVMTILAMKKYKEEHAGETAAEPSNAATDSEESSQSNYEELRELTIDKAIELIGKKEFNSTLSSVLIKNEAEFIYKDMLTVNLDSRGVKVYFPKDKSITNSMCSCKEKGMCRHKSYAIVAYMAGELKLNMTIEDDDTDISDEAYEFLSHLREHIAKILDRGLSSLAETETDQIDKMYVQAYGYKLYNTARELKSLSAEFNNYLTKNVSFSNERTLMLISKIYNRAKSIETGREDKKRVRLLAGKQREETFSLDTVTLSGLGALSRQTKRKDIVVNAYLYCQELKKVLTVTTLRPADANVTAEYLYGAGILWSDDMSFKQVSTSECVLRDAKMSYGKLSGTKATICRIKSKTQISTLDALSQDDFNKLREDIKSKQYDYFETYTESNAVYVLKAKAIGGAWYDNIEQKLKATAWDAAEQEITLEIRYDPMSKIAIEYMETVYKDKVQSDAPLYLTCIVSERGDTLYGRPVSIIDTAGMKNISFK